MMKALRFIFTHLGPYKKTFYLVVCASLLNGIATFYIPVTLSLFANNPLKPGNVELTIIVVIALYCTSLAASYVIRGRGEALAQKYGNYIRRRYFAQLALLSVEKLRKKHSGYIQSLVNKVADGFGEILYSLFWGLIPGLLLVVLFFIYIAQQSLLLAIFNSIVMVTFVIVSSILARKMVPIAAEHNRRRASVMGGFADFMANITTVVQLGIRPFSQTVLKDLSAKSDDTIDSMQQFHTRRWLLLHALFGVAFLATIGYIVWQITLGAASVGLLILFVAAYSMLRGLIEQLSENIKLFMEMDAYLRELDEFSLWHEPTHRLGHEKWREIRMDNITFNYDLSGVMITIPNFVLERGKKICVVGKSGQGKSTFLSLFTGMIQPTQGDRYVDDAPYGKVGRSFFASHVAVISQDAELFHMSVRDNLTLGRDIDDSSVMQYIDELELREWFDGLKDGLDSMVGEKGVTLSAGQRQRLNILRGVLLDRDIYVLDEPTSHLDAHTEEKVVEFLEKQLKTKTVIAVTHRPLLERMCDVVYEMKNHTLITKW